MPPSGRVRSAGSRGVGKSSYVDESLFGSSSKPAGGVPGAKPQQGEVMHGAAPKATRGGRAAPRQPQDQVVTLTRDQVARMLKPSPILSPDDLVATKRELERRREDAQAVSKARKERMLKLAEEAKKKAPESETDQLKAKAAAKLKSRAEYLMEEQKDEVKHMNQMVLYSKCVTIRDAQIEEKKRMMLEAEEENRRQDLMMEIERIKALEQYEARERQRVEERRKGAKVLEEQIQERERERQRQEELREQERIIMLREIERIKEDELAANVEKRLAAEALMREVAAANEEQLRRKEVMKLREREEDAKILEYTRAKDAREAQLAAEKERIAREKEMETARLRAMQERAADKAAELDELRARRHQEAKEREWRAKERAAVERQQAMQSELAAAREAQQAAKLQLRADMARREHDEFMRVLAVNRAKEAEDRHMQETSQKINDQYKAELQAQMLANEERRKHERQAHLEEGRKIREAAEAERLRLQEVKERKLRELVDVGVPDKYRAELERYKLTSH